jgi:hypothetical protein
MMNVLPCRLLESLSTLLMTVTVSRFLLRDPTCFSSSSEPESDVVVVSVPEELPLLARSRSVRLEPRLVAAGMLEGHAEGKQQRKN